MRINSHVAEKSRNSSTDPMKLFTCLLSHITRKELEFSLNSENAFKIFSSVPESTCDELKSLVRNSEFSNSDDSKIFSTGPNL